MPIHEYRCSVCGATSEFLSGRGEAETVSCRACGSKKVEKIISMPSIVGGSAGQNPGHTCCGREERCITPPCSGGGSCRRD